MKQDQRELLSWLVPGLTDVPESSVYWIERAQRALATSTQDRDVYPVVDHSRGKGVFLYDLEGNEYLDVTSGVAVRALGFRPDGIQEFEQRIGDVIEELPGQDFDNIPQILLAERLAATVPGDFDKQVFFTTSGGRAVETAMKAAMDQTGRQRFVAFRPAFHGRTGYALALTASKAIQKEGFPQGVDVIRTPYAYPYRCPVGSDPETCAEYSLNMLRDAILDEGTDIAAVVVESLAGEGGRQAVTSERERLKPSPVLGQMIVLRQVGEARHVGVEVQLHHPGRTVALLAEDDLGHAPHLIHVLLPGEVLGGALARLGAAEIVALAVHEHHEIRVQFDAVVGDDPVRDEVLAARHRGSAPPLRTPRPDRGARSGGAGGRSRGPRGRRARAPRQG